MTDLITISKKIANLKRQHKITNPKIEKILEQGSEANVNIERIECYEIKCPSYYTSTLSIGDFEKETGCDLISIKRFDKILYDLDYDSKVKLHNGTILIVSTSWPNHKKITEYFSATKVNIKSK